MAACCVPRGITAPRRATERLRASTPPMRGAGRGGTRRAPRAHRVPAALFAVLAVLALGAVSGPRQGDNLGVAGVPAGKALTVATAAPLAIMLPGLLASGLLVVATIRFIRGAA